MDANRRPPGGAAPDVDAAPARRSNAAELKIDLLCRGLRIPDAGGVDGGRPLVRTRAGLGSGLELILDVGSRPLWVNAPVLEPFARSSPYRLTPAEGGALTLADNRTGASYPVRLAEKPGWYDRETRRGIAMSRVGTLQGTCLSIYLGARCRFWDPGEPLHCKFCTSGLNVGVDDEEEKTVADVVETAQAARRESGVTFVHFNGGYQGARGLARVLPYVAALKREVGLLVGLQFTPEHDVDLYDRAIALGADHFSFCFELYDPGEFRRYLPGKERAIGRERFFRAMEYCSRRLGRGRVSGEIIAGIEPLEATLQAIEYIVGIGAFPLVCVFRPLAGADMQDHPPPRFDEMLCVFQHVYETCRRHRLPVGMAPNIQVSLSLTPEDTLGLAPGRLADRAYLASMRLLKYSLRPYFAYRMRPRPGLVASA